MPTNMTIDDALLLPVIDTSGDVSGCCDCDCGPDCPPDCC
jgi:hypothetical protein